MSVQTITKENFEEAVLQSEKPVLVDFWAPWCGPCRMVSPIVDEIAAERDDVAVGKVNVDEQPELAMQFGVMSIPTLLVFKGGEAVQKAVGARPKADLLDLLERHYSGKERTHRKLYTVLSFLIWYQVYFPEKCGVEPFMPKK